MGNSLIVDNVDDTIEIKVLVQFKRKNGTTYQGDFIGDFKRLPQERLDELQDPDNNYLNSELVDEVLVGVRGIGKADGSELPPDEALAWAKKTPECVNAAVQAFFKAMRPERYDAKTSRQRRGRG